MRLEELNEATVDQWRQSGVNRAGKLGGAIGEIIGKLLASGYSDLDTDYIKFVEEQYKEESHRIMQSFNVFDVVSQQRKNFSDADARELISIYVRADDSFGSIQYLIKELIGTLKSVNKGIRSGQRGILRSPEKEAMKNEKWIKHLHDLSKANKKERTNFLNQIKRFAKENNVYLPVGKAVRIKQ